MQKLVSSVRSIGAYCPVPSWEDCIAPSASAIALTGEDGATGVVA